MPLLNTDYDLFHALLRPSNDTDPVGGGIDVLRRPDYDQLTAADQFYLVSDGADTENIDIVAYTPAGVRVTHTKALTGATGVLTTFAVPPRWIMSVERQAVSALRTVTVRQGSAAGPIIRTIPPNEKGFAGLYDGAEAVPGSTTTRLAKLFVRLRDQELAAINASASLVSDTTGTLQLATENTLNGTQQSANRLIIPADLIPVDENIDAGVPGGVVNPGDDVGLFITQTLNPSHPAFWEAVLPKFKASSGPPP